MSPYLAKLLRKNWFSRPAFYRSDLVIQGVGKLFIRDFATLDHSLLKPHSPLQTGVGDKCNPKSLNLSYLRPFIFIFNRRIEPF